MARSEQSKLECETVIRWDESGELATLWTASPAVRKEWQSYKFPVEEFGGGWRSRVPVDRISYKLFKK